MKPLSSSESPQPTLHLDRSTANAPCFEDANGDRVSLESIFVTGFVIRPDDTPAVATWLMQFLTAREVAQR
jgi:hypothetical protein